jgi:hypothetical protein
MEYFVATSGNDTNPGSLDQPFRTVGRGVSVLVAGDVLNLRHGVYVESVDIAGKHGTADNPIVVRSYPGETAHIDGTVDEFRGSNNDDWMPARQFDDEAVDDEYVSAMTFTDDLVNRGAFLDRSPYTRLVTYSNINDLRADNETFDQIVDENDPRPGPAVTDEEGDPLGYRHPWVYMGPGIYFNPDTRRVHVRLSHTHNNVPGIIDYTDQTDPRRVPLAIAPRALTTLRIGGSSHLRLERLTISFGGNNSVLIEQAQNVTFDHVRIRAATRGIRMGGPAENPARDVVFAHCQFDGGIPPWFFRSDQESGYYFLDGEEVVPNNLGQRTSDRFLFGNPNDTAVEIHYCEFLNGHDMFLSGQGVEFHHNWINNLQNDGLALGFDARPGGPVTVTKIYENVITRTLTGFSFASRNQTTQWYIYRNLIDQRGPIQAVRPRHVGDTDIWRYGQLHQSIGEVLGPHDLFQNTVLAYDQREQASFLHYASTTGPHRRRSFNNVFVAVNPEPEADRAITFVPSPAFPGPTDGNLYHRIGFVANDPFRYLGYRLQGQDFPNGTFSSLEELRGHQLFEQSKTQYPPGYEANSLLTDPQLRRLRADGRPGEDDDLRLGDTSPALGAGIRLPDELGDFDPFQPQTANPDIGCYPRNAEPLRVGVDGCRSFPAAPVTPTGRRPKRLAGGVWKPAFLHEFLDGDPANLHAVPGELTVLPDGPVIEPTPDPADRGMLMAPGNRLLGYRFDEPFEGVIGVDLSIDLLYPEPNPFSPAIVPLVSLGAGAVTLSMGRLETSFPGLPPDFLPARVVLNVDGTSMQFDRIALPPFALLRTTRFRARWHTNGQAHIWHEGVLRAYEPGLAAGRFVTIDQLVTGIPSDVPRFFPRYRVRRVYLKLLRRDDAQQAIDRQVALDVSCLPPLDHCTEQIRVLQEELVSRTRAFMTGIIARLTTSWREGQTTGPFSPESIAANEAAVGAARAFGDFLETRQQAAANSFLQRIGEFFDILAAADPAGFAQLLDLADRAETVDPACRRTLEPVYAANAETLQPLARLLQATWQRAQTARPGGP